MIHFQWQFICAGRPMRPVHKEMCGNGKLNRSQTRRRLSRLATPLPANEQLRHHATSFYISTPSPTVSPTLCSRLTSVCRTLPIPRPEGHKFESSRQSKRTDFLLFLSSIHSNRRKREERQATTKWRKAMNSSYLWVQPMYK